MTKAEALEGIRTNIATYGHHVYLVQGRANPRYVYTIGVSESTGKELIFAGGSYYRAKQVTKFIERLAALVKEAEPAGRTQADYPMGELGTFSLREVHPSWTSKLTLGVQDYYKVPHVPTLQIVPDAEHRTIDVPDLSREYSAISEPIWQWLEKPWDYPVPETSTVMTNIDALRGSPITDVARWGEDDWEMFAGFGRDVERNDARAVPLGTFLGSDPSLRPITELSVNTHVWRDPGDLEWIPWEDMQT